MDRHPDRPIAETHPMFGQKPVLQARQRDIRFRTNACLKRRFLGRRQLARAVAAVGVRPAVPGLTPTIQGLVDIRHAHPEDFCDPVNTLADVNRRQNPVPEILRIALATTP